MTDHARQGGGRPLARAAAGRTPAYAPPRVALNAAAACSMSSVVWAADSCVRMRACPCGTTG